MTTAPVTSPNPPGPPVAAPDPVGAAERSHLSALLNCALRESGDVRWDVAADGWDAALPVLGGAATLEIAVAYRSPTGRHRYGGPPRLRSGGVPRTVDLSLAAALVIDALAGERATTPARLALLERIAQSTEATAELLADGGRTVATPYAAGPQDFLTSERQLVLGHPFHPTPKSRGEMRPDERCRYAPETGARFALRWLAVDGELIQADSAVLAADGTSERPAADVVGDLLPHDERVALAAEHPGRVLLPVHPWELAWLRERADVAGLLRSDALRDLGEHGSGFAATTSVRTVAHELLPWQLKFSLHLRVTNSMRLILPRELDRAVEAARLARTEVGARMAAVAPRWRVVHDPAYLAVRHDGALVDGLSVLLRENRWTAASGLDASAVASLCQEHPYDGRSRLARIVDRLAAERDEDPAVVARRWFAAYCEALVVSVLRIYLDVGLTFEPHAQNVVLELEGGWPVRAVHRDSQGYFHREAAHADLTRVVPGLGEATESIFPEALADQRLVYYPFVNNALSVIGALGMAGLIDERVLLADLRAVIERQREIGGRYPATLLDRLLDDDRWPCKANLRTRIDDLDELVGDIAEQSVYGSIANPLRDAA
jgi:siderophore synthetase component